MNQLLKIGQQVQVDSSSIDCKVEQFLGGGGQGEVYKATVNGTLQALKWYFSQQATQSQHSSLKHLIKIGAPNDKFLWPTALVKSKGVKGFGYIMNLRDPSYKSLIDLMKHRVNPKFKELITACFQLADSFLQLHAKGLCYRDISFGNVFFNPSTGNILICDNDNVTIDSKDALVSVLGTPGFMAPEVVRGDLKPSSSTDLYSLAVLLFYMLMVNHPLEGKRESEIKCFDLPARNKLYGLEPVFIFDPDNDSNRPVKGYHDNAIIFWQIYPQFIKDLFIKSFTKGLHDPEQSRVRESEWKKAMVYLLDSILYCGHCGAENFYEKTGNINLCWNCKKPIQLPFIIRINDKDVVFLYQSTVLYPHHIDPRKMYDFSKPVASMNQHPQNPNKWGLKNLSDEKWVRTTPDGKMNDIEPNRSVAIEKGIKINFGKVLGEILTSMD
jgi:eukaryotic-like serine/threonine-protein kinase